MKYAHRWLTTELGRVVHQGRSHAAPPPAFNDPNLPEHYPPDLELEPTHLDIDLYMSIPARSVGGRVTTTVQARHAGIPLLKLHAVDFADLFVRDLEGRKVTWQYDGTELTIQWADAFADEEVRRVEVAYRVIAPTAGLYFCAPDADYPNQPMVVASDHETERARHWLPCVDLPNVRTPLDFHLRADARFTILANGYLVAEVEHGDGTKTAHWRLEQPCPSYLICIAIGELIMADDGTFDDGTQSIPVAYFSGTEHTPEDLLRTFAPTKAMLGWMTKLLDLPFPYPKYYQFALPTNSGAMENISLVAWTDVVVQDAPLAQEYSWQVDQVNVHEMAHSYFGDAVVCRDYSHAWLKESWATYIELCWQEDLDGQDAADYVYYTHAKAYFDEADNRYQRPIITRRFRSSWDMYDAHLYEGGACRLHMLRRRLGDEIFWSAVRDYLKRYQHQVVETDDFRRVLEGHSGKSLGKFFDQWFRTPGFPDLKVEFDYDAARHEGTFIIEQKQVDKEKGIPIFEFTTEIGWTIGDDDLRRSIQINAARQVIVVTMAEKPASVRFDPGLKVLHRLEFNPGDPMLRAQLTSAPDVVGRIQAAQTLAKTGKLANIQAIVDAFLQEPFWGVRCEFAEILGNANHAAAIAGLVQLIQAEQEPRVLVYLLRAAGNYRSLELAAIVQARLQEGLRPIATRAAYMALGNQRDQAPFELLATAAEGDGRNWRAQSGALHGLGASRQAEALPILRRQAIYGNTPNRARPAAMTALGDIGLSLEKSQRLPVVEQLEDALRDPWRATRWAAANALGTLGAAQAIPALEAFGASLSVQEQAAVDRIIAGLRGEDKLDDSALKKQVDDLQEKVRTLEHQLQTLNARLEPEPSVR